MEIAYSKPSLPVKKQLTIYDFSMIKVGSFTIKLVPNYYISSQFVNILIKYVTIVIGWKVATVVAAAAAVVLV